MKDINGLSGIIKKSNDKSFFRKFHQNSALADDLFDLDAKYKNEPVIVIQVMMVNDGSLLAECVNSKLMGGQEG